MATELYTVLLMAMAISSVWSAPRVQRERCSHEQNTTSPRQVALIDGNSVGDSRELHHAGPPKDYVQLYTGGFYKVYTRPRSWFDAEAKCEEERAHLLVIESVTEAAAVRCLLASKNLVTERQPTFTLHAGFRADLVTVLGVSLSHERWDHGQPSRSFCGRIDNDAWLLYGRCAQWQPFVCEFRDSNPGGEPIHSNFSNVSEYQLALPPAPKPSQGYTPLPCCNGTYYKIVQKTQSVNPPTWKAANEICEDDGAHLPIIDSDSEAEDVIDFLQQSQSTGLFFLGITIGDPITVMGGSMSNIAYQRWNNKEIPRACVMSNKKLLYSSWSCDNEGITFLTFQIVCEINN